MAQNHPHPEISFFYDKTYPLAQQAAAGILRYVHTNGPWSVALHDLHDDPSPSPNCRGILACAPEADLIRAIEKLALPSVIIAFTQHSDETLKPGDPVPKITLPLVTTDSHAFGEVAADFFLAKPLRTFVYVPDVDDSLLWTVERGETFAARLREAGHTVHIYPSAKKKLTPTREASRLANWLKKLPRPLSIFASNDERARHVTDACLSIGLSVPHEAMILGIDNDEWLCETSAVSLSSIPFNAEESGFAAAKMLDELMHRHQRRPRDPLPVRVVFMPPLPVVERDSTDERFVHDTRISQALSFIRRKKGLDIRATDVADFVGISNNWLETRFRLKLGHSIREEIASVRLASVIELIRTTDLPFTDITRRCGFTDPSTLCRLIKKSTGKTMTQLRNT